MASTQGDSFDAALSAKQHYVRFTSHEKSVGHDTGEAIDGGFHADGVLDHEGMAIEDLVAVVGDHPLSVDRLSAKRDQLTGDIGASHGNDFNWQREGAELSHVFGFIGNANKAFGTGRDDLFSSQGGATALDHLKVGIDLIGAVNIKRQRADVVKLKHIDAMLLKPLGTGIRACHRTLETMADGGQSINEEVGGRAGADPEHGVFFKLRFDFCNGGIRHSSLELLLVHEKMSFCACLNRHLNTKCPRDDCNAAAPAMGNCARKAGPATVRAVNLPALRFRSGRDSPCSATNNCLKRLVSKIHSHSLEIRMLEATVKKILNARVYGAARETPISPAPFLSRRFNNTILIKREDLQPVHSFKIRGAFNKMSQLSDAQKAKGVIAASAGNHAQGLAMAAKQMGVKAVIVMPRITPEIKVQAVRAWGAKVVLKGDAFAAAVEHTQELIAEHGYTYIPPFDDIDVIAGQGTIAVEILRQHAEPIDVLFVAVGGGGLLAGVLAYIKYLRPDIKVIGVESEDSACLKAAMEAGERVVLDQVGVFAEGVAVAQIGEAPFSIIQDLVDDVITVNADEMCAAVKDIFEDTRAVPETSGALSLAGLKKYVQQTGVTGQTLMCINCGANINFDRLQHIAERTSLGEQREAILAVTIPEKPGSFKQFCRAIGKRMVTEFNYRYADTDQAHIFVGLQVKPGGEDRAAVIEKLTDAGYAVEDLTDNELAKLHIRHLGGGRPGAPFDEQLYRFEFPERPGALMHFLTQLPQGWNISLFHYRNHGAAYGRVLIGMQLPDRGRADMEQRLDAIGYRYWHESDNPAYRLFMA